LLPGECHTGEAALSCNPAVVKNLFFRRDAIYRVSTVVLFIFVFYGNSSAQELFINTEPASNMPRYSYGFRIGSESFSQDHSLKNKTDLEFMYEETGNIMTTVMLHASNYYGTYGYNNFGLYAKYRLYTDDGFKEHFRVAVYAQSAFGKQRNTFADVMLDGGNSGMGAGLIFTLLQHRLAFSSTLGAIVFVPDIHTGTFDINRDEIIYANPKNYLFSLSAGYLVYPRMYESYHDVNFNVYAELLGKYITYNIPDLDFSSQEHGMILDLAIGPQVIINSISRIDLSVRTRLVSSVASFPSPSVLIRYEQMFYH
jgi:hypothetical protein